MNILIYCSEHTLYTNLIGTIRTVLKDRFDEMVLRHMDDYDELRRDLVTEQYDLMIVAEKGAQGMEICIGARKLRPRTHLIWFSDDPAFAAQSYRLNCTYFGQIPVSQRAMANAFCRMEEGGCQNWALG